MLHNSEFNRELMKKIGFPEEAQYCFTKVFSQLDENKEWGDELDAIYEEYMFPWADELNKALEKVSKLADKMEKPACTMHMAFLLCCGEELLRRYREKGLSDKMYYDHMCDLKYKLIECRNCENCWGTFVGGWFHGQFEIDRFALGRFQFEMRELDEKHDGKVLSSGHVLHAGDKYVNFHIPSSGVPLTDEVRFDAYNQAQEFFKDEFNGGPILFGCGSWLLFDKYLDFLPEKSNTAKFIRDFEILEQEEKEEFNDGWRIFDRFSDLPVEQWPRDNSLRRAFAEFVEAGGKTGHGFGVILFDKGKIIR